MPKIALTAGLEPWSPGSRDFWGRKFSGTDMSGVDLTGRGFINCVFQGVSFARSLLMGVWFRGCGFEKCDFTDALCPGARFDGRVWDNSKGILDLDNEVCDPRGYRPYAVRSTHFEGGWLITSGCRWFTVAEALAHWGALAYHDGMVRSAPVELVGRDVHESGRYWAERYVSAVNDLVVAS